MGTVVEIQRITENTLKEIEATPDLVDEIMSATRVRERDRLYLDKAWHMLHYLLCDEADSGESALSWAVLGYQYVIKGSEFESSRLIPADKIPAILADLHSVNFKECIRHCDFDIAKDLGIYLVDEFQGDMDDIESFFDELKHFYKTMSDTNVPLLVTIG